MDERLDKKWNKKQLANTLNFQRYEEKKKLKLDTEKKTYVGVVHPKEIGTYKLKLWTEQKKKECQLKSKYNSKE